MSQFNSQLKAHALLVSTTGLTLLLHFLFLNIFNLYIPKAMNKVSIPLRYFEKLCTLHRRHKNALFPNSAISEDWPDKTFFKCLPTLLVLNQRYDVCGSLTNIIIYYSLFAGLSIFPKMKCLHLTTAMECNSFQILIYLFLSISEHVLCLVMYNN